MADNKVHFAVWINKPEESGHLSTCGIWNPSSFVYFTVHARAEDIGELMSKINCKECLEKTTLRDLV